METSIKDYFSSLIPSTDTEGNELSPSVLTHKFINMLEKSKYPVVRLQSGVTMEESISSISDSYGANYGSISGDSNTGNMKPISSTINEEDSEVNKQIVNEEQNIESIEIKEVREISNKKKGNVIDDINEELSNLNDDMKSDIVSRCDKVLNEYIYSTVIICITILLYIIVTNLFSG